MNEEERRQEILKAEETIHHLAKEMARASGMASQAEAARVALDAVRLDIIKSVDELNGVISTQKTTNADAMAAMNQAKKSLEDATSTLTDVDVHIDKIETHINEAVNEIRATAKIVESTPTRLSAALSRELSQADKSIEKRHAALMRVSENSSNKLEEISQSIGDNHKNISGVLDRKFSEIDSNLEEKHSASMQILENNSNKLKEISQSIDENHKNISASLNNKISQIDKASGERHSALAQSLDGKSKIVTDALNIQNLQLASLKSWGIVLAAFGLLGIWISAIILLLKI
jgi:DNA repair exonuclease SbcCD ATPase subunit